MKLPTLLILPLALSLSSCVIEENTNAPDSNSYSGAQRGFTQPLTHTKSQGALTIREGNRVLSVCRTASPHIEASRWHKEQEQVVVKSRGNHGPATVQLFDSRTGSELKRVMAYDIKNGKPAWAKGMGE